jgi:hypothetical protein
VCANLSNKLDVLRGEAEKLKKIFGLAARRCICSYPIDTATKLISSYFLMRTTPSSNTNTKILITSNSNRLMEPLLSANEELKMGVFAKLFVNAYPDGTLPEDLKRRLEIRMVDLTSATALRSRMPHMLLQLSSP